MINLQYAMEIWGLQADLYEDISTTQVADCIVRNMNKYLMKQGHVLEVGCSKQRSTHSYYAYVHFEFPPTTEHAINALISAFIGLPAMRTYLVNPFSGSTAVHKGVELNKLDMALKKIRQNQQGIKNTVLEQNDFVLMSNPLSSPKQL